MDTMDMTQHSAELSYLRMKMALSHFDKSVHSLDAGEKDVVDRLAGKEQTLRERILGSSEARGVMVPEQVVAQSLDEIRNRYHDADEFIQDLQRNGLDPDGLRDALRKELQVEAIMDRVGSRAVEISDIDVQLYYYLNIDKLVKPERRQVRHILITVNADLPENTRDHALARIDVIHGRVKKKISRFPQQALRYSECPSSLHGGLIGTVPKGQLFSTLDTVLFSMKSGEISHIVESEMGFHILFCEAIEHPRRMSLEELRPGIRDKLEQRQRRRCQGVWLKNLINSAKELERE